MEKPVRAAALLATIAIGVACTACASDASSSATALPTRSSTAVSSTPSSAGASSTPSSAADDVPPPPKVGQCRNNTTNLGENDWVDQTPVVDCSKTHTLQTLVVIKPVEKLTLAQAKQLAGNCDYARSRGLRRQSWPLCQPPPLPGGLLAVASTKGRRSELGALRHRCAGDDSLLSPGSTASTANSLAARRRGRGSGPIPTVHRRAPRSGPEPALDIVPEAPPSRGPPHRATAPGDELPLGRSTQQEGPIEVRPPGRPARRPHEADPHTRLAAQGVLFARNPLWRLLDSPQLRIAGSHKVRRSATEIRFTGPPAWAGRRRRHPRHVPGRHGLRLRRIHRLGHSPTRDRPVDQRGATFVVQQIRSENSQSPFRRRCCAGSDRSLGRASTRPLGITVTRYQRA